MMYHLFRFLRYISLLFLFWFLVFAVHRLFFIIYQLPIGNRIHHTNELFLAFLAGYRLDLATAAILNILPVLFGTIYLVSNYSGMLKVIRNTILILLIIYTAAALADTGLYHEWSAKINMQALEHFKHPAEVINTVPWYLSMLFIFLLTVFSLPFYYLYKRGIHNQINNGNDLGWVKGTVVGTMLFLSVLTLLIFIIRGGITNIPINQSVAFFSEDAMANDIAINPLYNIIQDATIVDKIPDASVYLCRTNEEAYELIKEDFIAQNDSVVHILNTTRPNLVFIILESWSADNISVLGGIEGCTPQFNALCKDGLLFTKAYSNGYVSDQGIPAILSAAASGPRYAPINQSNNLAAMPCLSEDLMKQGYSTGFMFGGDLVYGGLRAYLIQKKFQQLKDVSDWNQYPKGQLGVHDNYLFPELLKTIAGLQQPFMQCFFTSSTHMPYDYEKHTGDWQSSQDDPVREYTESMNFSDKHLGLFIEQAMKKEWYKNTLFIIVADHSRKSLKQWNKEEAQAYKIPLLITGGALREEWRGKVWDKYVSQLDIPATLLHQMNLPSEHYLLSRNIFNLALPSSCYYVFFDGCGYINENGFSTAYATAPTHGVSCIPDSSLQTHYAHKAASYQQLIFEMLKGTYILKPFN